MSGPSRWGVIVALLLMTSCAGASPRVCGQRSCVTVEIADTPEARARGLMFRERLPPQRGMLFVFDTVGEHPFWMKDTLIPLDMIWIDEARTIVDVAEAVPPCTTPSCPVYGTGNVSKYVLEVAGGEAKRLGFIKGTEVVFQD